MGLGAEQGDGIVAQSGCHRNRKEEYRTGTTYMCSTSNGSKVYVHVGCGRPSPVGGILAVGAGATEPTESCRPEQAEDTLMWSEGQSQPEMSELQSDEGASV